MPATAADDANAASEPTAFEWSLLDRDIPVTTTKPVDLSKAPGSSSTDSLSWKRADKDGSSDLSVKQPIVPFWDSRVGADMKIATQVPTTSGEVLTQHLTGDGQQSNGTAWAAMTAPGIGGVWDKTALEARIDPAQDQTKLGTALSKSLPFAGGQYSLTLQNGYNVTEQSAAPVVGGRGTRNYEVDRSAKLSFDTSGTSLIAGQTFSTSDEKWLGKIGAEQKLFGGVSVSGTVSETPTGLSNKTLSAGFKHSW
jgi:hypothetical protein